MVLWIVVIVVVGLIIGIKKMFSPRGTLRHIPGPTPKFFFGNAKDLEGDVIGTIQKFAAQYGGEKGVSRYHYFSEPILLLSQPRWVQYVLQEKSENYEKERDPFLASLVGNGLLVSQGKFWARQRKLMTPCFTPSCIREMYDCFTSTAEILLRLWAANLSQPLDIRVEMTKFTLDVIALASFSYELNSITDRDGDLPRAITTLLQEVEARVFRKFPFHKIPFSPPQRRFQSSRKVITDTLQSIITQRRREIESDTPSKRKRKDVLDRLIEAEDEETGERITDAQLLDEAMAILLAGHETTANGTAFTFWMLSEHPEEEEKVKEEIDRVVQDRIPTYQNLSEMEQLDAFVKESLRMYPPAAQLADRLTKKSDVIGDYAIPQGTLVEIWPHQLHHDPRYWKDPEQFNPSRFLDDPKLQHSWAYLPFSRGPRSCIGQSLAILEIKVMVVMTLQRYRLKLAPGHSPKPKLTVTLRADDVVMLLEPREH